MKRAMLLLLALLVIATGLIGCASTDPFAESSMPWNTPQSWEGTPGIPGLEGR